MQEVYFENIRDVIIKELEKSTQDIKIAVAWFTDKKIISILESKINCKLPRKQYGLKV